MQSVFKRKEIKYRIDRIKYEELRRKLEPYMSEDEYGLHTICSIYFDNDNDDIIRKSLQKPVFKEKLRLRSYGIPKGQESTVFLELKKKYNGIVYKRRIPLTYGQAEKYIANCLPPEDSQIFREIDYFRQFYGIYPKIFIGYDRIALYGKEDNGLRLTFDFNIRCRRDRLSLSEGDQGEYLLNNDDILAELKVSGAIPVWLTEILTSLQIYPSSFSKYGEFYKKEKSGKV